MSVVADTEQFAIIQRRIRSKAGLKVFYERAYEKFKECAKRCPADGLLVELGAGAGFAKSLIPELITSDMCAMPGVERIVDATQLEFQDLSLRAIFMLNVFHHISDVREFFSEARRCLVPGGRVFMVDHFPGWIGRWVYRFLHSEPFRPEAETWSLGAGSGTAEANAALAWIVFERDIRRFEAEFPSLQLARYEPHTPLLYWLSGGLKWWTLTPATAVPFVEGFDAALTRWSPKAGSFVDIEIVKT